jgi:hypothetical protein
MNVKLLAFCIGDGTIGKNYYLNIRHCEAQKEYLEWKKEELSSIIPCSELTIVDNNGYVAYDLHTKTNKSNESELKEIKEKLYSNNNKKYFSDEIVNALDAYCFAVLYMDDGSLVAKYRNGKIHSYNLTISLYCTKEECDRFIIKLATLGMKFTLMYNKGKYSIRCGTKAARKFIDYIKTSDIPELSCFCRTKFKPIVTEFTDFKVSI